jgi:alkanesulfonate monooxygenase SsuD/methylene tetrahydromethanopterin reductase-like flavin-dependent oxidoreductase (luciferase family)
MRCGISLTAMNYSAWPAFDKWEATGEWTDPPVADFQVVQEDVEIGLMADELGFDSLWTVEHHTTPYNMCTNPLQWLTYFAGATSNLDFGTMVVVLPWHHPVRVAEDITMLHNLIGEGRKLTIGVGRGAARREFRGLGIPMDESRERFLEVLEVIKRALSQDVFSFEGEYYNVPSISIRPQPRNGQSVVDDLHCAWGSAQTIPIAAEAGLKPLVIPQKPLEAYVADLEEFARLRGETGHEAADPIIALSVYCAENEDKARRGAELWFTEYSDAAIRSYELAGRHFAKTKGYESYAQNAEAVLDREAMAKKMGEMWVKNHVWGTPEMCIEKIRAITDLLHPAEIINLPRVGDMPFDEAKASMRLFAQEVLPAIHEIPVGAS